MLNEMNETNENVLQSKKHWNKGKNCVRTTATHIIRHLTQHKTKASIEKYVITRANERSCPHIHSLTNTQPAAISAFKLTKYEKHSTTSSSSIEVSLQTLCHAIIHYHWARILFLLRANSFFIRISHLSEQIEIYLKSSEIQLPLMQTFYQKE